MTEDDRLAALFEDLETQADGLYLDDRDREVEALAEAGYAEISLADRVHASVGSRLRLGLVDGSELAGVLRRCGREWLLLDAGSCRWLIPAAAMSSVEGLPARAAPESSRPRTARLSVASALRGLAEEDPRCVLRLVGDRLVPGVLVRVGADFVVVRSSGADLVVPFGALVAVRSERG